MTNATPATATVAPGAETPATQANDKRIGDLLKQVAKFGEESALGNDSLPKLAHAVVGAAADGIIDLETKDGKGNDAAFQLYSKYAAAESKKAIHEHSSGGFKGNVSKLRQLIAMGCMTTVDAKTVMQDAFKAREDMISDSVKVKSAYPFYVDVAREQLKTDKPLTARELEAIAMKDEPAAKTLEGELKRVQKILEGLVTGENRDKIKDADPLTEQAFNAVRDRLSAMATLVARQKLMQEAAKLGIKLA
jgi:hypothetical protein